jgi:hypothetical protein
VGPPVIDDGVSDQHVPQFAPPRDVFSQLGALRGGVNSPKVWMDRSLEALLELFLIRQ